MNVPNAAAKVRLGKTASLARLGIFDGSGRSFEHVRVQMPGVKTAPLLYGRGSVHRGAPALSRDRERAVFGCGSAAVWGSPSGCGGLVGRQVRMGRLAGGLRGR